MDQENPLSDQGEEARKVVRHFAQRSVGERLRRGMEARKRLVHSIEVSSPVCSGHETIEYKGRDSSPKSHGRTGVEDGPGIASLIPSRLMRADISVSVFLSARRAGSKNASR
jgi:hypothetical protein